MMGIELEFVGTHGCHRNFQRSMFALHKLPYQENVGAVEIGLQWMRDGIHWSQFPNVDGSSRTKARNLTYREIPPVPNNLKPYGFAIVAAFGKLTTQDATRFLRVTGTNKTVRCYLPLSALVAVRLLGGWCRLLSLDSSHLTRTV